MTVIISGDNGVSDVDGSAGTPAIRGTDANTGIFFPAADTIAFSEGGAEAMRIDSSGNVLVGTTGLGTVGSSSGFQVTSGGSVYSSSTSDSVFARRSTDGDIILFRKDTTTVGSIGTLGSRIYIGGDDVGLDFEGLVNQAIVPFNTKTVSGRDNAIDLGSTSYRFDDIYATNGTIQTSDRNEKQDIKELTEAETRVAVAAKGLLRKYRWKSAVAENGDEARIHFGIIAQDLQAAFEAEGLDAGRYAMFIHSEWTDEETGEQRSRMGIRYNELLAFIIAAI
jgi:hypothetical protein